MKKSLTQVLVLAALAGFTGLAVAQQIFKPKSQPTSAQRKPPIPQEATTVKSSKSNASERLARSQKVITGKVTKVNAKGKTFAVEVVFSAAKLRELPTAGEIFEITYTQTPGGPMEASNLNLSKSNIN